MKTAHQRREFLKKVKISREEKKRGFGGQKGTSPPSNKRDKRAPESTFVALVQQSSAIINFPYYDISTQLGGNAGTAQSNFRPNGWSCGDSQHQKGIAGKFAWKSDLSISLFSESKARLSVIKSLNCKRLAIQSSKIPINGI